MPAGDRSNLSTLLPWLVGGKSSGSKVTRLWSGKRRQSADAIVKLNVGGREFSVNRSTFDSLPEGSPLKVMLVNIGDSGAQVFIDRDGRHFHQILAFLREGPDGLVPPDSKDDRYQLYHEACFYQVTTLVLLLQDAYPGAAKPYNEATRLAKLDSLKILHSGMEKRFDHITGALAYILNMPIALLTLVSRDTVYFKARHGLDAPEVPRNTAWCAYTLLPSSKSSASMLLINDTTKDPRAKEHPLVVSEANIRFYAGCPLVTSEGLRLGTLCVLDRVPRQLKSWELQLHANLAQIAVQEMQREELHAMDNEDSQLEGVPTKSDMAGGPFRAERMREALDEMVCLVRVSSSSGEWPVLYANQNWASATGVDVVAVEGESLDAFPRFWSLFQPSGRSVQAVLAEVEKAWGDSRGAPHVFGLSAQSSGAGGSRSVSCRFVPADQPLDLAAAAVDVPQVKPIVFAKKRQLDSYYYFVIMASHSDEEPVIAI